ncbi:hypothetical protein CH063_12950 [Colletotrichum higginsianum]|uniref:Uncharacterized protein n=2 Tax=Colletotrichum higginsianum TaxID=80884 RepID=H1VSG8_COLHI|nr:hypothetical protein CH63R_00362 [Colletotrichum higginsianum IMI 349063]OBR15182.1 hypothetical protein CH63R_00362 [Colletotrichum higginsianum IMI 349063]TID04648.1 hypothetical protein CH35J_002995 [Colletotrichum higginsianum]CCF43176.1 hypothetical protein CH063_12950 [Colletotrichum higginsianum]
MGKEKMNREAAARIAKTNSDKNFVQRAKEAAMRNDSNGGKSTSWSGSGSNSGSGASESKKQNDGGGGGSSGGGGSETK